MAKVKYGLSNIKIFPRSGEDGSVSYGSAIAMPGAVSLSIERESETSTFYADNTSYWTGNSNSSITLDGTVADVPREVMLAILNYVEAEGGGILETSESSTPSFGITFQVQTDTKGRKFAFFNCTAVLGEEEYNTTEDTIEPTTTGITITCSGEPISDGQVVFSQQVEPEDENYSTFDTTLAVPSIKSGS